MSWFLYLIECADDSVYTGITTDVAARFDEHAAGKGARYTRSRKPRTVLASFPLPDRSSASRAEYWVKRLTAAQKRELAAGSRTLESVLPAVTMLDGSGDMADSPARTRGRKKAKAKAENIDNAKKTAGTEEVVAKVAKVAKVEKAGKVRKAGKPAKTAKTRQAARTPNAAKAAPVAKRAEADGAAVAKKVSARATPAQKNTPSAAPASKRKAPVSSGKPVANEREAAASAPGRRRPPATKAAEAAAVSVAPRRAKRAKDAPDTTAPPASASARKKNARAKQNRAAS
ncbi:GIY-YIG nuclease family protein [Burkholderia catarinensis]|uniref:GIY-YIG nuclease family protein n=1 Tax=Burkholderia catarinensis TaxID=1108140 RepID=UPI0009174E07|nr:GIY-YIG nuclease family protein [Burkholderia catarinensis]KAG8152218.1 hypothetical protein BFF94_018700 [Burkholderia catarinensis]